jgi:signal peptidase I
MTFAWVLYDAWRPTKNVGWKRWCLIVVFGLVLIPTLQKKGLLGLFGVYKIPTASMSPTLRAGEDVFCLHAAYWHASPQRGDIVAFSTESFPTWNDNGRADIFIKRVVGLPGDVLQIKNNSLLVNGVPYRYAGQQESYSSDIRSIYLINDVADYVVPKSTCFVIGDHCSASVDSRYLGPIPFTALRGKIEAIILPPGRSSRL